MTKINPLNFFQKTLCCKKSLNPAVRVWIHGEAFVSQIKQRSVSCRRRRRATAQRSQFARFLRVWIQGAERQSQPNISPKKINTCSTANHCIGSYLYISHIHNIYIYTVYYIHIYLWRWEIPLNLQKKNIFQNLWWPGVFGVSIYLAI